MLVQKSRHTISGIVIEPSSIRDLSCILLLSAHLMLDQSLEAADKLTGVENPASWLRFQDALVGTLKDHLAMEAATEWLQENYWKVYSRRIKEYLRFATNDASSFGKLAEKFLAMIRVMTHVKCSFDADGYLGTVYVSTFG